MRRMKGNVIIHPRHCKVNGEASRAAECSLHTCSRLRLCLLVRISCGFFCNPIQVSYCREMFRRIEVFFLKKIFQRIFAVRIVVRVNLIAVGLAIHECSRLLLLVA